MLKLIFPKQSAGTSVSKLIEHYIDIVGFTLQNMGIKVEFGDPSSASRRTQDESFLRSERSDQKRYVIPNPHTILHTKYYAN